MVYVLEFYAQQMRIQVQYVFMCVPAPLYLMLGWPTWRWSLDVVEYLTQLQPPGRP
jgi:hypothetical protein